jgi:hypothetical protein
MHAVEIADGDDRAAQRLPGRGFSVRYGKRATYFRSLYHVLIQFAHSRLFGAPDRRGRARGFQDALNQHDFVQEICPLPPARSTCRTAVNRIFTA